MAGTHPLALIEALPGLTLETAFLAVLVLGVLGALRRVFTRSPGAWLGFLPLAGLALAIAWPETVERWVGAPRASEVVLEVHPEPAEQARDGRGPQTARDTWLEWQETALAAPSGTRVDLRGDLGTWFDPPSIPSDARPLVLGEPEPVPSLPDGDAALANAPFLWHAPQVPAGRAFEVWWTGPDASKERTLVLAGGPIGVGNEQEAPVEIARLRLGVGESSGRFVLPAVPEAAGSYRLTAAPEDDPLEFVASRVEVLPRPRAVLLGEGLDVFGAALGAQGYEVRASEEAPYAYDPDAALWIVGRGEVDLERVVRHAEKGGGVLIAAESAWERFDASPLRTALPAFPGEPLPTAPGGEEGSGEGGDRPTERTDPTLPENVDPLEAERQEVDIGSMGLLVLLDVSGSFHDELPTAWEHVAVALRESKGFDHVGVVGFAGRRAERLLPFRKVDEGLEAELVAAKAKLRGAMSRAAEEGTTRIEPGLSLAREVLAPTRLSAKLIVVVSDGGFLEQQRDWNLIAKELYQDVGVQIAAIFMRGRGAPMGGLQNMQRLATIGGTKRAREVNDLTRALQLVPVIAREIAEAQVPPRPPEEKKEEPEGGEGAGEAPEEPREARTFHVDPTGTHPAEGQGNELLERPWPPLSRYRPAIVRAGSGVAWRIRESEDPLGVTGHVGRGRMGVLTVDLDSESWPAVTEHPAFPLFCARIADYLSAPPEPPEAQRLRSDGAFVREGERVARLDENPLVRSILPRGPVVGTFVRDPLLGVYSTLRTGRLLPGASGEVTFAEHVASTTAEELPATEETEFRGWREASRISAVRLGVFVALGLLLEVLGIALRLRLTFQQR